MSLSNSVVSEGGSCIYCNRLFHHRDLFDQHVITCEWFYKRRRDHTRELELYEPLPSPQESYRLIQHLALQVSKLQREVLHLRQVTITRKRKIIMDWLQSPSNPVPAMSFLEWIKQIPVQLEHLQTVFRVDLIEGMKQSINAYLSTSINDLIPICAFRQKSGTIFIYSPTGEDSTSCKWHIMSGDEFDRWIDRFGNRFLQVFLQWQIDNSSIIRSTEEEKEKNIENMRRINGLSKSYEDRRRSELRKWLFSRLETDFARMVEYEYV